PLPIQATSNSPVCLTDTIRLYSTMSSAGTSYTWTGPGSFYANTQNTITGNSNTGMLGWYTVTATLNGCSIKDSTNVVSMPPTPKPIASYGFPLCVNETLILSASTVANANYIWKGPGGFISTTQNSSRNNIQFTD